MNTTSLGRIIKNGFLNYRRNFWLSMAATIIMIITLFVIGSLLILNGLANASLVAIQEKVDISVYFRLETTEQTIGQIQRQIELLPEVRSVVYIPPVEARERFRELHRDEPLLLESLEQFSEEENPFPASFAIRVRSLEDYPTLISLFEDEKFTPFVKKITDKRKVVDRLNSITGGVKRTGLGLTLLFSLVTVAVMFNTIRLTIHSRREEIEIMRLVGASNVYIKGPFVTEGLAYGVAGAMLTAVVLYPMVYFFGPQVASFLEIDLARAGFLGAGFLKLFGLQLILGCVLGVISSLIVIRKYLRV